MEDPVNIKDPDLQLDDSFQQLLSIAEVQVQVKYSVLLNCGQ